METPALLAVTPLLLKSAWVATEPGAQPSAAAKLYVALVFDSVPSLLIRDASAVLSLPLRLTVKLVPLVISTLLEVRV